MPGSTEPAPVGSSFGNPSGSLANFALLGAGTRTVWARFYDAAGNESAPASAGVIVDLTRPAAAPPALVPSAYTTTASIQLVPPAAGQDEMQLAGNVSTPSGWVAAPPGAPVNVTLAGSDGAKSIWVSWRDLADNMLVAPMERRSRTRSEKQR